ncbi:MAG: hypothetical protein FWE70_08460, partial [Oscillospiraceae bacterium]|nr:hypothetical protein [Oscillospiraceae bacterium]
MGERHVPQLMMTLTGLEAIPYVPLPEGYALRLLAPGEEPLWEALCDEAFGRPHTFAKAVAERRGYVADGVFMVMAGGEAVATGTAICDHEQPSRYGYVHMIAAKAS